MSAAADLARCTSDVLEAVRYEVESELHDHPNGTIRGCLLCTAWKAYARALEAQA